MSGLKGVIAGALVVIALTPVLGPLGPFMGGAVAGLVGREGPLRGCLLGLASGVLSAVPLAVIVSSLALTITRMPHLSAGLGAAVLILLGAVVSVLSAAGGCLGGLLSLARRR